MPSRLRLFAALSSLALLWGLAFVAIKEVLPYLSPVALVVARFMIADTCFLVMMLARPSARPRFERRDLWRLLVIAITGVAGYHLPLNWGEARTSASIAALIIATAPAMVAVSSPFVLHEWVSRRAALGIALAFGGVAVLAFAGPGSGAPTQLAGIGVLLLAPVSWAVYTLVAKPLTSRAAALRVTATTNIAGSLLLLPFVRADTFHQIAHMPADAWVWIVFLGAGSSALGYVIFLWALTHTSATQASVLLYAVPVVGVLSAWLIRNEPLGAGVPIAAVLVITGVAIVQRNETSERRAKETASL